MRGTRYGAARIAPLLLLATLAAACPPPGDVVSDDPKIQQRYELGKDLLKDIRRAKLLGQDYRGECTAVRRDVIGALRKSTKARVKTLRRQLVTLCAQKWPAPASGKRPPRALFLGNRPA